MKAEEQSHRRLLSGLMIVMMMVLLPLSSVAGGTAAARPKTQKAANKLVTVVGSTATSRHRQLQNDFASFSVRGGSSYHHGAASPSHNNPDPYYASANALLNNNKNFAPPASQEQQQQQYENNSDQYFEPPGSATTQDEPDPLHETVQERLDQWRTAQLMNSAKYQESPLDDRGRRKLLTSVGKGSRAAIFFFLMWRDVHLYESAVTAATARSSISLMILTVPLIMLFLANMAGAVVSLTSPSHAAKKRLKAILNLDKLVEVVVAIYAALRLTIWPGSNNSRFMPRELHINSILHAAFFFLQCQAFTRLSWDENAAQPISSYAQAAAAARTTTEEEQQQQQQQELPAGGMPARPPLGEEEWSDDPQARSRRPGHPQQSMTF